MKNPWILPAAALLVGGAGGFFAGKNGGASSGSSAESSALNARSSRGGSASTTPDAARAARAKSLEEIYRQPGHLARIQELLAYYENMTPEQLEAEAGKLEGLPMNERLLASFILFGKWAETDPNGAMAYSDKMGFAGMFVKPTILQSWASLQPELAAQYFAQHPREFAMMGMGGRGGQMGGQSAASIIASEWAKNDPEGALAWAKTLDREKGQAMTAVLREIAATDPQKASTLLASIDESERGNAVGTLARQWGAKNFSEAETWIRSLPADQQDEAMASALRGLAGQDPQLASQKVAAMADGEEKNRALSVIAETWSRENPKAALDWLVSQGNDEATRDGMRDVMGNLARQDDAGAVAFINQQQAGDTRDEAIQTYIFNNRSEDPKAVMTLAESMTDEGDRQRAVGMAAMQWMREDANAAKDYIQQSTVISDEAKQRLQEGRGFWGGRGNNGGGQGAQGGGNGGNFRRGNRGGGGGN